MSVRHPLLRFTDVFAANGAINSGHGQRNGTTFCLLTNPVFACNITMFGFEFGDTEVRCAELLRYASPHWSCIWYHGLGCIGFHCHTPLVHIFGTLNSQRYMSEVLEPVILSYIQLLQSAIFQQDNTRSYVTHNVQEFFFTHQIELFP
ncbi:transposable element Tcb1 transposase [Trichonephila clavipes]|nr:transposable element Tcb1 transposase [Trichonephila clavipes]